MSVEPFRKEGAVIDPPVGLYGSAGHTSCCLATAAQEMTCSHEPPRTRTNPHGPKHTHGPRCSHTPSSHSQTSPQPDGSSAAASDDVLLGGFDASLSLSEERNTLVVHVAGGCKR